MYETFVDCHTRLRYKLQCKQDRKLSKSYEKSTAIHAESMCTHVSWFTKTLKKDSTEEEVKKISRYDITIALKQVWKTAKVKLSLPNIFHSSLSQS